MHVVIRQSVEPRALLGGSWETDRPTLCWLGQAGFLVRWGELVLMIDPYLSDSLAAKYRGQPLPYTRLMPPPITSEEVCGLDLVLCTHAHTDHMDPDTLSVLAAQNPSCRFVVPRAALGTSAERGVPPERAVAVSAGEDLELAPGIALRVTASAHEQFECDGQGNHYFLGYILRLDDATVYHSGDCVPFPELSAELARAGIDVAILPVNGRDDFRRSHGIAGNFTYHEAVQLCCDAGIGCMIACHFGMFDFNGVDVDWLERQIAETPSSLRCIRAKIGEAYELVAVHGGLSRFPQRKRSCRHISPFPLRKWDCPLGPDSEGKRISP
jgi:L-ascorbate metabolism protein UlaG (beta-lactamase superfamily)